MPTQNANPFLDGLRKCCSTSSSENLERARRTRLCHRRHSMALRLHETVIHTMPALPKTIAIDSAVANVCCLRGYAFPLSCIACGMSGLFVPAIDSKQCRKSKTGVPGSRRACISDPRHHVGNPTCMSQASRSDQNAKST